MVKRPHSSISALHRRWAKRENEHHELTITIAEVGVENADLASMRERQAKLLLDIEALKAEIRRALPATIEDIIAVLDVVLDHETDLARDIANYGSIDYPIIAQLLGAAARLVPGFEFNSLRSWLSPTQFEELFPRPKNVTGPVECFGFGQLDENSSGNLRD